MTALGLAAALPFNQTKGDPLLSLGPVFAIRAKDSVEGEQWALNSGTGGQILRARYGSVGRAEIRRGVGLILPGVSGNLAYIPDSITFSDDLDVKVKVGGTIWGGSSLECLAAHWNGVGNNSWFFGISSGKNLELYVTTDGSSTTGYTGAPLVESDGVFKWYRATRRRSDGRVQFFKSDDGETWVQHGTDGTIFSGSAMYNSTANITFGANASTSQVFDGIIQRVKIASSIDGTALVDVDFTQQNDLVSSFTCTTGQTVTVTAANAVDTNDPYLAVKRSVNYVKTFASGGYFRTKNVDGDFLNGAIELDARVAFSFDAVTNASASSILISRGASTPATAAFRVYRVAATTNIRIEFSDGAAFTSAGTVAMPTYAANEIVGLRITAIMGGNISYQWKSNLTESNALDEISSNTGWTEFGTGSTAVASLTNPGSIGVSFLGYNSISTSNTDGKIYAGWVSDDIDGTPDIKFSTNGVSETTIYNTVTGNECFLSRASSGKLTAFIETSKLIFGTDDYLEVADNDLLDFGASDSLTALVVLRRWVTLAGNARYVSKRATVGYTITASGGSTAIETNINDGTWKGPVTQTLDLGVLGVAALVRDIAGGNIHGYLNGSLRSSPDASPGSLASSTVLRVGAEGGGSLYADAEIYAVYIFRQALTAAQIAACVRYWNAA